MECKVISDKILLPDIRDVLRIHFYIKFMQKKIQFFDSDLDIIIELYLFGGYSTSDEQKRFIRLCLSKKYKKSIQSVRNSFSRYVNAGVLIKNKNRELYINEEYLPTIDFDKLILSHIISHAN